MKKNVLKNFVTLVLLKNHLNYLKDNFFELFFKKYKRLITMKNPRP